LIQEIITLKTEKQQINKILQNDNKIKIEEIHNKIKIEEIQENNETKQNSADNNIFLDLID
jgi:hypothetical protein